jgi:hypothetical protein
MALAVAAVVAAGCMPVPGELGASTGPALGAVDVDPNYHPREGDRAVLFGKEGDVTLDAMPIMGDMTAFDKYERAKKTKSTLDLQDLEERGWLKWTAPGTRVLIKTIRDRTHTVGAEVRLLDGPYKDTTAWTPIIYVTRFMDIKEE